ncbi:hypothetical protein K523DRAFT_388810 [Schizophyllum commune Tattone D]|nr:hypothetical protein K523DRAFT_388810 [Schizophyllum commune Tattone D]
MAMTPQIRGDDGVQSSGLCYSPPRSKPTRCQLITGRLLIFPSSTSAHALYGTSAAAWEVCRNPRCADCSATHCKLIVRGLVDFTEGRCARESCQLYCLEGLRPQPPRDIPSSRRPHLRRHCHRAHNKRHTRHHQDQRSSIAIPRLVSSRARPAPVAQGPAVEGAVPRAEGDRTSCA